jgi:hypothetical protein
MECQKVDGGRPYPPVKIVTPSDDGRYEIVCPLGHKTVISLQQQKFEVLFEIGAYAIVDGYYREAVSSFTSSLERFYEFFCKAYLYEKAMQLTMVEKSWKPIAKQSERQLGAFIMLYTSEFGEPPILIDNKHTEFRNKVIHDGKIPKREEAVDYGQTILDSVRPLLSIVKEKFPIGVDRLFWLHIDSANRGIPGPNMSISTILNLDCSNIEHDEKTLEVALSELMRWK